MIWLSHKTKFAVLKYVEKITMFDFKFLLVCSLVCSLPVIPSVVRMTSQIWMVSLKLSTISRYCQSLRYPYRKQNKRFSDKNISKDIGKAFAEKFAQDS